MPLPSDPALELPLHLDHLLLGLDRLDDRFSDLDLSIRSSGVEIEACGLTCISAIGIGFTHPVLPTRGCIIRPHEDPDLGLTSILPSFSRPYPPPSGPSVSALLAIFSHWASLISTSKSRLCISIVSLPPLVSRLELRSLFYPIRGGGAQGECRSSLGNQSRATRIRGDTTGDRR